MNRWVFVLLLGGLALGCATSPSQMADDTTSNGSVPHTEEDVSRRYSVSLVTVFEACKLAIEDIGADHLEPTFEMEEFSATITAATETRLYGILLLGYDEYTDVMLFLEDKSSDDVISKSVFDEFWNAVETALFRLAVRDGQPDLLRTAIEAGVDVNAGIWDGYTALIDASLMGYVEVVRLLLESGARVDAVGNNGVSALLAASQEGHADVLRLLIEAGAGVNNTDANGLTPLMYAVASGNVAAVTALLDSGADSNVMTPDRRTALTLATAGNHTAVKELIWGWQMERATTELESSYLPFATRPQHAERIGQLYGEPELPSTSHTVRFADLEVPERIRYVRHSAEANTESAEMFLEVVGQGSSHWLEHQGDNGVIVGPHLTNLLKHANLLGEIEFSTLLMGMPDAWTGWQVACSVQHESLPTVLRLLRNLMFSGGEVTVRNVNDEELDWYWASIGWDLEDPLLIFENDHHSLLIEFRADLTVFFVDLMENLTWYSDLGVK